MWFPMFEDLVPNHLITANVDEYPEVLQPFRDQLEGRSMLVRRARPIQVECVARGYLAGSGWKEYQESGTVCGIPLPEGLKEGDRLPEPIFTPATKAKKGNHDINITFEQMCEILGRALSERLRELTLAIYNRAHDYCYERGVILADTKFEFGFIGDVLSLIDEILSPDSSRFWPLVTWKPGQRQESLDKQPVRDYYDEIGWDRIGDAPPLPEHVVTSTTERYRRADQMLFG